MRRWYEPEFVGIVGSSRVGKDTTGRVFAEMGYKRVALADPLKEMAWSLNPILRATFTMTNVTEGGHEYPEAYGIRLRTMVGKNTQAAWEAAKDNWPEVRQFLIDLGTAGRSTFAENVDFWVNRALERADGPTVFTDIRFLNEAARLRATKPTFLIRITRPGHEPSEFEQEVPRIPVDATVDNDGDVDDLGFKVREAYFDWLATKHAGALVDHQAVS